MTGLGTTTGLTGCSRLRNTVFPATETDEPATDTEDSDAPSYQSWLPSPAALPSLDHYDFIWMDYAQVRANESQFGTDVYTAFDGEDSLDALDISRDDIDELLFSDSITDFGSAPVVIHGTFEVDDIADRITSFDYERNGEYDGYTLYTNETNAAALTENTLLFGSGENPTVRLTAIADANQGEQDLYGETNDDMAALQERLGDATLVTGETREQVTETDVDAGEFEGQVGYGGQLTVDGETTSDTEILLFDTTDAVDMDAVSEYSQGDRFEDYRDVTPRQDGRAVIITGTIDTADLFV